MRGLAAGAGGLTALALCDRVERMLLGRPPVYSPPRMLRRSGWPAGVWPLVRAAYGLALGAALAAARRRLPRSTALAGAVTAGVIFAGESWALPATGATPPLRAWGRGEHALLFLHTLTFGLAAAAALDTLAAMRR